MTKKKKPAPKPGHKIFDNPEMASVVAAMYLSEKSVNEIVTALGDQFDYRPSPNTVKAFIANYLGSMDPDIVEEACEKFLAMIEIQQESRALLIESRANAMVYYEEMIEYIERQIVRLTPDDRSRFPDPDRDTAIARYLGEIRQYRAILDKLTGQDRSGTIRSIIKQVAQIAVDVFFPAITESKREQLGAEFQRRLMELAQSMISNE